MENLVPQEALYSRAERQALLAAIDPEQQHGALNVLGLRKLFDAFPALKNNPDAPLLTIERVDNGERQALVWSSDGLKMAGMVNGKLGKNLKVLPHSVATGQEWRFSPESYRAVSEFLSADMPSEPRPAKMEVSDETVQPKPRDFEADYRAMQAIQGTIGEMERHLQTLENKELERRTGERLAELLSMPFIQSTVGRGRADFTTIPFWTMTQIREVLQRAGFDFSEEEPASAGLSLLFNDKKTDRVVKTMLEVMAKQHNPNLQRLMRQKPDAPFSLVVPGVVQPNKMHTITVYKK